MVYAVIALVARSHELSWVGQRRRRPDRRGWPAKGARQTRGRDRGYASSECRPGASMRQTGDRISRSERGNGRSRTFGAARTASWSDGDAGTGAAGIDGGGGPLVLRCSHRTAAGKQATAGARGAAGRGEGGNAGASCSSGRGHLGRGHRCIDGGGDRGARRGRDRTAAVKQRRRGATVRGSRSPI
jgi:hypothetical protein